MRTPAPGSACERVEALLDQAMSEGVLILPPELQAHAAHCPRCSREFSEVSQLLTRLRGAAAGVDLGRVPQVVDRIMADATARGPAPPARKPVGGTSTAAWVLGQIAAVAVVVLLMVGGLTYALLKANEAVGGAPPGQVVERLLSPFRDLTWVRFRGGQ